MKITGQIRLVIVMMMMAAEHNGVSELMIKNNHDGDHDYDNTNDNDDYWTDDDDNDEDAILCNADVVIARRCITVSW